MAVLTAKGIANVAVPLLTRTLVLARTVTVVPASGFTGPNGETITVRVRQPRTANEQSSPGATINYSAADEVPVDVSLKHLYDAHLLSDEEASYELEDFAFQVTAPQVAAVATKAEDQIAGVMNALPADINFASTASEADTDATILAAREALSDADCPPGDRWLAVSPSIATRILSVDKFTKVNESGSPSALRDAVIGRLYGFTVVESNGLTTDTAVAYHRSGFVMANKKPENPRGATSSATVTADGWNLRQIFQYVPDKLSDASIISTFAGCSAVLEDAGESSPSDSRRFVKIGVESSS